MPLSYHPPRENVDAEKYVLKLLNDIRSELVKIEETWGEFGLHKILQFIEKGKLIVPFIGENYDFEVDLSPAQEFIENYRFNSEGGCKSRKNVGGYNPFPGETRFFCGLYEKETGEYSENGFSQRTAEYFETGCEEKEVKFRPLEEVLKEVED